ncbi:MAG TPA: bifunctional salicylyl-CoA 5-hydroxylase/oxidoreductase [Planctomycetota bacterium]|nr:bifunctional salicylyl-CoA 5-hydroxylase/oxidoreductase [Planctomycetota bacterium]
MRIACVGGGPASLYFAILIRKANPSVAVDVYERNRHDDTFGWGVVFSDETLGNFEAADPETYAAIRASFRYWNDIETYYGGTCTRSTGHGFCGLARRQLLLILQERARALGVRMHFEHEVHSLAELGDAQLVVAGDGINSMVRTAHQDVFQPRFDWRKCKFAWFGTDKDLRAFTFVFQNTQWGLFQVHAYPFADGLSTWIVECREETWRAAGLDRADEAQSARFCEELFDDHLRGHRLLLNKSVWRTFPTITCKTWHHDNIVLLGDAAHTAHFSIGSGTKLAMEDAIALAQAFAQHGLDDVPRALAAYEAARYVEVLKTQRAAQTSLEWFENSARYLRQDPLTFTFNLMTRSKRITWDNLGKRDPALVDAVRESFAERAGAPRQSDGRAPVPVFTPFKLRDLTLANRIVVSPMCQYSAVDGTPNDWHLVHLGSRAVGGAGLVIAEMTNVAPEGRITPGCAGMYRDEHVAAWRRIVDFVHRHTRARIGIQLAHAGRKGAVAHPWEGDDQPLPEGEAWTTLAPSAIPFRPHWRAPRAMTRRDMDEVREAFVRATAMADAAGFDFLELHMAHGYLLSSFLSPLSNRRTDEYGGDLAGRMRYPLEVFAAVRKAWPAHKPISVRVSATDWMGPEGTTPEDTVVLARALSDAGCDLIDVSSGGNVADARPDYGRMYQVPFAEQIRHEVGIPVMAVGAILGSDHCNTILAAGRADLCCMARPHLGNPYLTLHAAAKYGFVDQPWPGQYLPGRALPDLR